MATVATGRTRIVSVLIADVVGSTAIGERLGPERSKFLIDEVMRIMGAEVQRYDGTVAQLVGDELFAIFGAPIGHEDDSERAVLRRARDPARDRRATPTRCATPTTSTSPCASASTPARSSSRPTTATDIAER